MRASSSSQPLLACHEPYWLKPNPQGCTSAFKRGSRHNWGFATTLSEIQKRRAPEERFLRELEDCLSEQESKRVLLGGDPAGVLR